VAALCKNRRIEVSKLWYGRCTRMSPNYRLPT
jgi:hypothetical protein